jgi:hypothetical protein
MLAEHQADEGCVVDQIALYYPYIHVRNDVWLKYAALYWPKMGRLLPPGYPTVDSETARVLSSLRWLIDVPPPRWAGFEVGRPFLDLIATRSPELRDRFGLDRINDWEPSALGVDLNFQSPGEDESLDLRMVYIHGDKVSPPLAQAAVDAGLATIVDARGGTWMGMHPKLASVYTCALTEHIADRNRMHPVTDQLLPHFALSGWTLDRMARVLIDEPLSGTERLNLKEDLSDAFVLLAFETVVPAHLDTVPIEKIVEMRSRFGAELDSFRDYVAEQAQRLAELKEVRDLAVFQEYLHIEVQRAVTKQLSALRERLRSIGLESARAVANIKSVGLPPLAAMLAETAGLPPTVTGPTVLAACVVSAPSRWRQDRRTAIRESPAGYLFRIEQELSPTTLIGRLRRTWLK